MRKKGVRCRTPFAFDACSRVNLLLLLGGGVRGRVGRGVLHRLSLVLAFVLDRRGLVRSFVLDRVGLVLGAVHDVGRFVLAGGLDVLGLVRRIGFDRRSLVLGRSLLVASRKRHDGGG